MPTTMNGIGTHYCGKDNRQTVIDACGFCGHLGQLESYDTTLYAVFFFLPILQLKPKRVLLQCPACTRHYAVPLGDWQAKKQAELSNTSSRWTEQPQNRELALEALQASLAYQDAEAFQKRAAEAHERFPDDAELLAEIAHGHALFQQRPEAIERYRQALERKDDHVVRENLAMLLMDQRRPDQSAPLIEPLLDDVTPDKHALLIRQLHAYQAAGKHQDALRWIEKLERAAGNLGAHTLITKAKKQSTKRLGSGKPIVAGEMKTVATTAGKGISFSRTAARRVARLMQLLILIGVGLIVYGLVKSSQSDQDVYLVNGLNQSYTININNHHKVELPPFERRLVQLHEGPLQLSAVGEAFEIPPHEYELDSGFWARVGGSGCRIINLDRCAVMLWENQEYTVDAVGDPEYEYRLYSGKPVNVIEDVDFPFQEFPDSIMMPDNTDSTMRSRVSCTPRNYLSSWHWLQAENNVEAANDFACRVLRHQPEEGPLLRRLALTMRPVDFAQYARPQLDKRPITIAWHRRYQDCGAAPADALRKEYDNLVKSTDGAPAAKYLRSRLHTDLAERRRQLHAARVGAGPGAAYAGVDLAVIALSQGEFPRGLGLAREALVVADENDYFRRVFLEAMLANGKHESIAEIAAEAVAGDVFNSISLELHAMARRDGDEIAALKRVAMILNHAGAEGMSDEYLESWEQLYKAELAYARGDLNEYRQRILRAPKNDWLCRLQQAMVTGDLEKAQGEAIAGHTPVLALAPYLVAPDRTSAASLLKTAATALGKGPLVYRQAAKLLTAASAPALHEVRSLVMLPSDKAMVLAALGQRFPALRADLYPMAQKLNVDPRFPHQLLKAAAK